LAAGELVRKTAHERRIHADPLERPGNERIALAPRDETVNHRRFTHDIHDAKARVQRSEGVLENHLDGEPLGVRLAAFVLRVRSTAPQAFARAGLEDAGYHPAQRRLAATRFPNEAHHFTFAHGKAYAIHGVNRAFAKVGAEASRHAPGKVQAALESLRYVAQLQ
jgi:hypothetical protein